MALRPISESIQTFRLAPSWSQHRQLHLILSWWPEMVGPAVVNHTVPLRIQNQILYVATSTPAWAQNLAFQRHLILTKINNRFPQPLKDIRFLPGEWHRQGTHPVPQRPQDPLHPPQPTHRRVLPAATPQTPQEAFERWRAQVIRTQRSLPPCPTCGRPTPEVELQRWFTCGFCHLEGQRLPTPYRPTSDSPDRSGSGFPRPYPPLS